MFFGSWISCRRFASFSSSSSIFVLRFFSVVSRDVKERERERERERESTRARFSLLFFKLSLSLFNKAQCNKVSLSFSSAACPLKKKTASLGVAAVLVFRVSNIFFFEGSDFFGFVFVFLFSLEELLRFSSSRSRGVHAFSSSSFKESSSRRESFLSVARVVPFLLPFSFLEQKTRFRFLEQTT